MLDLDPLREAVKPVDAATLIVLRDGAGLEVFCVERNKKSGFLGGAIVFPGGKVDEGDKDPAWLPQVTTPWVPRAPRAPIAPDEATLRALAIAACREALEEAAILPVVGRTLSASTLLAMRQQMIDPQAKRGFFALLAEHGLRLDLAALRPFSRWVTPVAESRRFDARFYLVALPRGQEGMHDDQETTHSFWATPRDVLKRFDEGSAQLAPPQHRLLEVLAGANNVAHAFSLAEESCLDVICPELVKQSDTQGETLALVLPGDPEHSVKQVRIQGKSRFVLRDGRFVPSEPPARRA